MVGSQHISCLQWPVITPHAGGRTRGARVPAVLSRVTTAWASQVPPEASMGACEAAGYPSWRDRGRTPVPTIQLGLVQMRHGTTAGTHLPPLSGLRFRASASWHARAKLPRDRVGRRCTRLGASGQPYVADPGRGPGHRPVWVEGSGGSRPDPPALQEAFGQATEHRPGCGVPVAHLLGRCHAGTGLLLTRVIAPRLPHELAQGQPVPPA